MHALESAADAIAPDDDPFDAVDRDGFGLDSIARDVQSWRDEVHHGRGFVLLRGFPVDTWSRSVLERAYYGLGSHFGHAVSQSTIGDRLGHVLNVGDLDGRERAYRNRRGLKLHTDRCDVIGMLCVRPALRGGVSGYASAAAIFNAMLAECPGHLGPLFEGYQYHRFGEQAEGDPDYTRSKVPIFSLRDGALSIVYLRTYMEMAAYEMGRELPGALVEALDRFESVSNREDIRLDFLLEPRRGNILQQLHHAAHTNGVRGCFRSGSPASPPAVVADGARGSACRRFGFGIQAGGSDRRRDSAKGGTEHLLLGAGVRSRQSIVNDRASATDTRPAATPRCWTSPNGGLAA